MADELNQNPEGDLEHRLKDGKDVLGDLRELRIALADDSQKSLTTRFFYRFSTEEVEVPRGVDSNSSVLEQYVKKMGETLDIPDRTINNLLENDEQLAEEFAELRKLELIPDRSEKEQARREQLIQEFEFLLVGDDGEENYQKAHNMFFRLKRERHLTQRVVAALPEEQANVYLSDLVSIWQNCERGEITQKEYFLRREKINEEMIQLIGNDDLKEFFASYKRQNESSEALWDVQVNVPASSEEYVEDVEEVTAVLTTEEIKKCGFDFEVQSDGSAIVNVGSSAGNNFPVSVSVARLEDREYVYYLNDDYTNSPVRVEVHHLSEALDLRHVDSYFSHEISPYLTDIDSVNSISDRKITRIIYFLIGNGKERKYTITGDDKFVLDNLISLLIIDDDKYPGLDKKIDFLNNFIMGKERGASVRRFLLNSSSDIVFPISELGEHIGV